MKHLTRLFILTALICSCSFYAGAQTAAKTETAVPKGAASYIDTFFKKYKTSPDSAIDYIFGTNPFFTGSQIAPLKAKLDSLQFILGKFVFMFYKPKNDWLLYRFNFDDAMDVELLEASRINNKRP